MAGGFSVFFPPLVGATVQNLFAAGFEAFWLAVTLTCHFHNRCSEFIKLRRSSRLAGDTAFQWVNTSEGDLETRPV